VTGPKPIQTTYAGCLFRSRLEARWAVFFDTLGIEWEYEAEGYETATGRYLPDFWLPELRIWVEVKGKMSHADLVKVTGALWDLRAPFDNQIMPQLLFLGPVPRPGSTWTHVRLDLLGDLMLWQRAYFDAGQGFWITKATHQAIVFNRDAFGGADEELTAYFREDALASATEDRISPDAEVEAAYRAARSARFEFGVSG
jgi:hypothetical protein